MEIETATLIAGSEVFIRGARTEPFRASVRIGENKPISAIVKKISKAQVIAECYAAVLLIKWGLPVPTPLLVIDGDFIMFGSTEEYPSLKQRLNLRDDLPEKDREQLIQMACEIVSNFNETPKAIAADEAIDNRDRNFGNILWDGGNPSFIDHEGAFGLNDDKDNNKLADMAIKAGMSEKISPQSVALSLTLNLPEIKDLSRYTHLDTTEYSNYVSGRINSLACRVLDRFPRPTDLLTEIT